MRESTLGRIEEGYIRERRRERLKKKPFHLFSEHFWFEFEDIRFLPGCNFVIIDTFCESLANIRNLIRVKEVSTTRMNERMSNCFDSEVVFGIFGFWEFCYPESVDNLAKSVERRKLINKRLRHVWEELTEGEGRRERDRERENSKGSVIEIHVQ